MYYLQVSLTFLIGSTSYCVDVLNTTLNINYRISKERLLHYQIIGLQSQCVMLLLYLSETPLIVYKINELRKYLKSPTD